MAWFKVDDGFHASKKLLRIPRSHRLAAAGLWVISGSWSAHQLTDGLIPDYMIDEWGGNPELVSWLVKSGLWERADDGGQFVKWSEYQPTKADVEAERERNRAKLRKWRERNRGVTGLQDGSKPVSNAAPDPTRPDPTNTEEANASSVRAPQAETPKRKASNGTRLPEDWKPSEELRRKMSLECPTVDQWSQFVRFKDYWASQPGAKGRKSDWDATYRNWIRKAAEDSRRPAPASSGPTQRAQQAVQAGIDLERMMGLGNQGNRELTS